MKTTVVMNSNENNNGINNSQTNNTQNPQIEPYVKPTIEIYEMEVEDTLLSGYGSGFEDGGIL